MDIAPRLSADTWALWYPKGTLSIAVVICRSHDPTHPPIRLATVRLYASKARIVSADDAWHTRHLPHPVIRAYQTIKQSFNAHSDGRSVWLANARCQHVLLRKQHHLLDERILRQRRRKKAPPVLHALLRGHSAPGLPLPTPPLAARGPLGHRLQQARKPARRPHHRPRMTSDGW